jgi:hypothetical protein
MVSRNIKPLTDDKVNELWKLFGPPPVLSSEDKDAYEAIKQGYIAFYRPRNSFHLKLVRELVDTDWEISRLFRDRTTTIERRTRTLISEPIALLKHNNRIRKEKLGKLNESQKVEAAKLQTEIWDAEDQLEKLERRQPDQFLANTALEHKIEFFDSLDKWLCNATARRDSILKLLEYYSGPTNDAEISEAEYKVVEQDQTKQIAGPPVVPPELIANDVATQNSSEQVELAKE